MHISVGLVQPRVDTHGPLGDPQQVILVCGCATFDLYLKTPIKTFLSVDP